jgi:hypothetical protein
MSWEILTLIEGFSKHLSLGWVPPTNCGLATCYTTFTMLGPYVNETIFVNFWYFIRKFLFELLYPNTTPTSSTVKCYKILKLATNVLDMANKKLKIKLK